MLNKSLISDVEFDGIDYRDAPDFCDAYVVSANYDGNEMTDEQLDELNDNGYLVHDLLMKKIY